MPEQNLVDPLFFHPVVRAHAVEPFSLFWLAVSKSLMGIPSAECRRTSRHLRRWGTSAIGCSRNP